MFKLFFDKILDKLRERGTHKMENMLFFKIIVIKKENFNLNAYSPLLNARSIFINKLFKEIQEIQENKSGVTA